MTTPASGSEQKLVQTLAHFVAQATFDQLPRPVVQSVKQRVLDTLGISLAAVAGRAANGVGELVDLWGGREEASLVYRAGRFPAPNAALFNGTLAHSLDFDDTHLPSVLHPSASVIPATLALGEALGVSGRNAIVAASMGYEVIVRLGMAAYDSSLRNSIFFEKGWHATSICGTIACAALGAKLLKLDEARIADAIGIAASMASGLLESNRVGGLVKQIHCGWAAHGGLTAALLAERGITSPSSVLEGRFGFFNAFCDGKFDPSQIINGLGEKWVTPDIFFKPYPSNHFTHAAIDAALAVKTKYGVRPEAIDTIELGIASAPFRTIGEPREKKIHPENGYHARFSGPFAVATAFFGSTSLGISYEDFGDDKVKDPARLALAGKVHMFVDPECERIFPNQFPAVLRVRVQSGETFEERIMANRGGSENPLTDDELVSKFLSNVERFITRERALRLRNTIYSMENLDHIGEIMATTKP